LEQDSNESASNLIILLFALQLLGVRLKRAREFIERLFYNRAFDGNGNPEQEPPVKPLFIFAVILLSVSTLCASAVEVAAFSSAGQSDLPDQRTVSNVRGGDTRYDVTQFGAIGDGKKDDTAAIQATFDACWKNGTGTPPYGGVVEFPGSRAYVISDTINAYDSCRIEGIGVSLRMQTPPELFWNGVASGTTILKLTGFTIARNTSSITFLSTGNAIPGDTVTINGTTVRFVASGAKGNEVNIGVDYAATATALCTMLNASIDSKLRKSKPYSNPSAGVVDTAWQSIGYVETLTTTSSHIRVGLALGTKSTPRSGRAAVNEYLATFPTTNSLSVGNWVLIQGFSGDGVVLNRTVAQVAAASVSSFTVALPFTPFVPLAGQTIMIGAHTDSGTASTTTVVLAFDTWSRNQQEVSNLMLHGSTSFGVGIYFGSRIDTGSRALNTWVEGAKYFGYYFSAGGINVEIDNGSRCDGAGIACMYWRAVAGDNFRLANSTFNVSKDGNGAAVMLDSSSCDYGIVSATLSHLTLESDAFTIAPGLGIITLYDCGADRFLSQFSLNLDNVYESETSKIANPGLVMSPANDGALQITAINSTFNGQTAANRWVGVPALARGDMSSGLASLLNYSLPINSIGLSTYSAGISAFRAPTQFIGDVDVNQLWQYGVNASAFLYSDTAFQALPNATTLFAGQIVAPPAYWSGVNGKRYAIDVVYQTGTTGTPNGGTTKCTGAKGTRILTCSSATDLSIGQRVTIGPDTNKTIKYVDATHPGAVQVSLSSNLSAAHSGQALSFSAPLLASEIQMPTKFPGAPRTETWSQGDVEFNSKATATGIAAWVNVAAGTPGRWAAIPLGNSSGQIAASQISETTGSGNVVLAKSPTVSGLSDTGTTRLNNVTIGGTCSGCSGNSVRTAQAFCTGQATSSSTLAMFGAGSAATSCTSSVGSENATQLLMNTSGTLSSLAVRCAQSGTRPQSGVFSVWDLPSGTGMSGPSSGTNTGLTLTYGTAKANTTLFDLSHSFAYAKGDLLRIQFTTQANETLGECEASFNY